MVAVKSGGGWPRTSTPPATLGTGCARPWWLVALVDHQRRGGHDCDQSAAHPRERRPPETFERRAPVGRPGTLPGVVGGRANWTRPGAVLFAPTCPNLVNTGGGREFLRLCANADRYRVETSRTTWKGIAGPIALQLS